MIKDQFELRRGTSLKAARNRDKKYEEQRQKKVEEESAKRSKLKAAEFTGKKIIGLNISVSNEKH